MDVSCVTNIATAVVTPFTFAVLEIFAVGFLKNTGL
jgi:hypothetical protein